MKALLDADILRYEIGYAAETGWKAITEREESPPFDYVQGLLEQRIASILQATESDSYSLFLTEGKTFRYDVAKRKEYKGTRSGKKPWHYVNLTAHIKSMPECQIITGIEADDAMAIEHIKSNENTIICSRDKDLRQIPGFLYSWELGRQPSFGPKEINEIGDVYLSNDRKTLKGEGYAFFCSQLLTGDVVDNIPGVPFIGAVGAYTIIQEVLQSERSKERLIERIIRQYRESFPSSWENELLEQGRLCWIIRKLDGYGSPVMWEIGMTE